MLVLSRLRDETIMIGDEIEITIVDIRGDKVRLGINAPTRVSVHRKEVYEAIRQENSHAARAATTEMDFPLRAASHPSAPPAAAPRPVPTAATPRRTAQHAPVTSLPRPSASSALCPPHPAASARTLAVPARAQTVGGSMMRTRRRDGPPDRAPPPPPPPPPATSAPPGSAWPAASAEASHA